MENRHGPPRETFGKGTALSRGSSGIALKAGLWIAAGLTAALFYRYSPGLKGKIQSAAAPEQPSVMISSGSVQQGDSLIQIFHREGLPDSEVRAVVGSLKSLLDVRSVRPGQRYELTKSTSGEFVSLRYWSDPFNYYSVEKTTAGGMAASERKVETEDRTMSVAGTLKSSLWEAMTESGVPPGVIYQFADIFAWQVDFLTEPRVGDRFALIWKRRQAGNAFTDGDIVAAVYKGEETGKVAAVHFERAYYAPDGTSLERQFLRAPLKYRYISSRFTNRRYHPILRIYRPHHGIDYAAPTGTPISAVGDGVVIFKGWKGGYGRFVEIRHGSSGYVSEYGHMSRFMRGVGVGTHVRQGQIIGYVGSTGLSTGPHLHFGFERYGKWVNFLAIKPSSRRHLSKKEMARFSEAGKPLLSQLDSALAGGVTPAVASAPGPSSGK